MLVPYSWLKSMVDAPEDIAELTEHLALTGTEVEGVSTTGANLEGIVVGHILTREAHPDSDHLWVTTVDVGEGEPLQIVCGAQNFQAGDKVPVAKIGTIMPDGTKIKKGKLRGVESCGMNCSGRELGVSDDHSGLLILPEDASVGIPIGQYLGLTEVVIDAEITPNRPDCMSMVGMAREVGAIYDLDVHYEPKRLEATGEDVSGLVEVEILDGERCPRYTARVIKGVKIGPSPDWLVKRVTAAGARSINNIVDVTNYILFELGQPLHAFDYNRLGKGSDGKVHIQVRAAVEGEEFTTLDQVERTLTSDMTVIADGTTGKPIALAGVMGGLESEVEEDTVDILLESATFSSSHTSRTSRNLQLFSESSQRYERGVDAAGCEDCSLIAASLMVEVAGGTICSGVVDAYPVPAQTHELLFRVKRFQDFVGASVPAEDAQRILTRLGCQVSVEGEDLRVIAPTFRPDLTREADLYEEVLRVWGMDKVPATLPGGRGRIGVLTAEQLRTRLVGQVLRSCGLNETMTYAFVPADDLDKLRMPAEGRGEPVQLINPMSAEQSVMRRSLIPGLLRSVVYNQSRGTRDVHLYEVGMVFGAAEGKQLPKERQMVAGVLTGSWTLPGWNQQAIPLDFFDGKGVLEKLFRELCISKVRFSALEAEDAPWLQPGRAAQIKGGDALLGWLGEIHPLVCADFEAEGPVVAFELDMTQLLKAAADARPFQDIPTFPAVEMDLAIVVDEDVTAEKVQQVITSAGGKMLESARLFDVYRDEEKVGAGKKSLAFSLTYRAPDRTLTSEEVEKVHDKVVRKACGATGGEVRS